MCSSVWEGVPYLLPAEGSHWWPSSPPHFPHTLTTGHLPHHNHLREWRMWVNTRIHLPSSSLPPLTLPPSSPPPSPLSLSPPPLLLPLTHPISSTSEGHGGTAVQLHGHHDPSRVLQPPHLPEMTHLPQYSLQERRDEGGSWRRGRGTASQQTESCHL